MINQGYQNPGLLQNAGLGGRFAGAGTIAEENLWLQPRAPSFAMKPQPDVQLLQNQQLYSNGMAFKQNAVQNNLYVANDGDFSRQPGGFLQQQTVQNPGTQYNQAPMQNMLGNPGAGNWQMLQQNTMPHQQFNPPAAQTQFNQILLQQQQQQQQQQQRLDQFAAALNAQRAAANTMQARAVQMQQAGQIATQNQFNPGNAGFIGGMNKAGMMPAQRMVQQSFQPNTAQLPGSRLTAQPAALNNGFTTVGTQGLVGNVGQGMNAMGANIHTNNMIRQAQQAQLRQQQQQAAANARANFQLQNQMNLAGMSSGMVYQAPVTTTSMMLDNHATLIRMQQQQLQQQQQNLLKSDYHMLAANEARGLAAGISPADMNGYGTQPLRNPGGMALRGPAVQQMVNPSSIVNNQFAQARRNPYDMPVSMGMPGLMGMAQDIKAFGANGGIALANAGIRPPQQHPQQQFRPAFADGAAFNGMAAPQASRPLSPVNAAVQVPVFVPPKTFISDAQVVEGMAAADAVAKTGPPSDNVELYKALGQELARTGLTVEQAMSKGLLGNMNAIQVGALRDACAAELTRTVSATTAVRSRSSTPNSAPAVDAANGVQPPVDAAAVPMPAVAAVPAAAVGGALQPADAAAFAAAPATTTAPSAEAAVPVPSDVAPVQEADAAAEQAAAAVDSLTADPVDAEPKTAGLDADLPVVEAASAGGMFNAFEYGFFAMAPVEDVDDGGLLEALEPDGSVAGEELEGAALGDDEEGAAIDMGDDEVVDIKGTEASAPVNGGTAWATGAADAPSSSASEGLTAKFHHLDLGCGFA